MKGSTSMDKSKIERINELSRKSKSVGLTPEEKQEQQALRAEYIGAFRNNMKSVLESIVLVNEDGTRTKVRQKKKEPN